VSQLSYSSPARYRANKGVLTLDGGKLVFSRRGGLLDQSEYIIQTIPLTSIRSVEARYARSPVLVITVESSSFSGIPRHEFSVPVPEQWISAIQNEMKINRQQVAQSQQPTYVKEVVREIVKYPCPYCNSLIEVTSSRCPICGAPQKK
jgi:hypothetical protein